MLIPILVMLAQAPETAPEAAPAPAEKPGEKHEKPVEKHEKPAEKAAPAGEVVAPPVNADSVSRQIEKMKKMSPEDAAKAAEDLAKKLPHVTPDEVKRRPTAMDPPVIPEVKDYTALPEIDQVKYSAREFFTQL